VINALLPLLASGAQIQKHALLVEFLAQLEKDTIGLLVAPAPQIRIATIARLLTIANGAKI
jgi:hypothetical protein